MATLGALSGVTARIGPAAIPIWFTVAGAVFFIARGPIGQALARRISGDTPEDAALEVPPELYAELDELRARVGELEERVDFSERILAQKNAAWLPERREM